MTTRDPDGGQQPPGPQQWGPQQPYGPQQWAPPQPPGQQSWAGQQAWGGQQPYGQQSWGGQRPYGQQAWGGQQPYGTPSSPPERPQELETSFYLWIAAVVVGLVGSVVAFSSIGSLTDAAVAAAGGGPGSEIAVQAVTIGIVVGAVIGLGVVVLEVVFAVFLRRGRNWARITLAVIGGIGVLFAVIGAFGPSSTQVGGQVIETGGALTTTLSLLQAALILGAIVMSFRPPANAYVAAVSAGAR